MLGISIVPVNLNNQQLASSYLFTVAMKVAFTDTHTQDVIWSNESLIFRGEYDLNLSTGGVGADLLDTQRTSMDRIATDVARSVVTAILEAF